MGCQHNTLRRKRQCSGCGGGSNASDVHSMRMQLSSVMCANEWLGTPAEGGWACRQAPPTRLQPSSCSFATGWLAVTRVPKMMSRFPRGSGRTHVSVSPLTAMCRLPKAAGRNSNGMRAETGTAPRGCHINAPLVNPFTSVRQNTANNTRSGRIIVRLRVPAV